MFNSSSMLSFFSVSTENTSCPKEKKGRSRHDTIDAILDRKKNASSDLLLFIERELFHRSFSWH
jgi:hypothetical protein